MVYADYVFYRDTYHGSAVDEDAFPVLSREASLFIDQLTYNRLNQGWQVTDAVKMATCAVTERIQLAKQSGALSVNAAVKSENNDGYSVAYHDLSLIRAQLQSDYEAAAYPYLIYTGLLDRSIGRCCR